MKNDTIFILGASKLNMATIIPMLLGQTINSIIVFTTSKNWQTINDIYIKNMPKLNYKILHESGDTEPTEFLKKMNANKIQVGIVEKNSKLYNNFLKLGNGNLFLSACRNGLFEYLPDISQNSTKETIILSFDNDKNIALRAQSMYKNNNLKITKCIAHSVCDGMEFDITNHNVTITSSGERWLAFPPEAQSIQNIFNKHASAFSQPCALRFAKTQMEYDYYINSKLIDINAMHTLICIFAYEKGFKMGLSPKEISVLRFSDLLSEEEMIENIKLTHSLLYDKYLKTLEKYLNETKEIHELSTLYFIRHLFHSPTETVQRGLDFKSLSFESKISTHVPLLKSSENTKIIQLIDNFMSFF